MTGYLIGIIFFVIGFIVSTIVWTVIGYMNSQKITARFNKGLEELKDINQNSTTLYKEEDK